MLWEVFQFPVRGVDVFLFCFPGLIDRSLHLLETGILPLNLYSLPGDALAHFRQAVDRGREQQQEWKNLLGVYREAHPAEAKQLDADLSGDLPSSPNLTALDCFRWVV
mgnify:CR=1 FL=1